MKKERHVEIKLKTERTISIKSSRSLTTFCEPCGKEVQMFTPGQAALISGLTSREVYHRVEVGGVHFTETAEGLLLVCLESLLSYQSSPGESGIEIEERDTPTRPLQEPCSSTERENH
ncbi:MAG: hypothetical protein AB1757_06465 [Acidobacteriota bacterium]